MNVWREPSGAPVAQVAIHDEAKGRDRVVRIRIGDSVRINRGRYQVVRIEPEGMTSDWIELAP